MSHTITTTRWKWFGLLLLPAVLWLSLNQLAAADEAPLHLTVEASPESIAPGSTAIYTLTLTNNTNISRTAALSATLNGPVDGVRVEIVSEATQSIETARSNRTARRFQWGGEIGPNGMLTLRLVSRAALFDSEGESLVLAAAAGPGPNNLVLQAQASVDVNAPPAVQPGDIAFDLRFTDTQGNPLPVTPGVDGAPDQIPVAPGDPIQARLSLTNTSGAPLVALVTGAFTPTGQDEDAVCDVRVIDARIATGTGQVLIVPTLDDRPYDYALLLNGPLTSTVHAAVQLELLGGWECTVSHQAALRIRPVGGDITEPILPRPGIIRRLLELPPRLIPPVLLFATLSDLGDAPDSTNHFGVNMTAYPGVIANFPTVFDPATGLPSGPRHRFVRPLFLGDRVSVEAEADLTVLPINRNLDPPNDIPDLDRHDDGVNVGAMSLQHCVPTAIPFRVTISQAAVDRLKEEGKTAYFNVWLDGNRDGDWDDVLNCDGIQATEHIVIDQIVSPAAGGVYNLTAPTRNLPIPPNMVGQEMWLRATLSDEPSVKTGQVNSLGQLIDYGDGRGPANGFRLGETEDYLVKPVGYMAQRGPDLTVEGDAVVLEDIVIGQVTLNQIQEYIQRLRVRNLGDAAAGGTLIIRTQPYLGIPTVGIAEVETAIPAALPFQEVCDGDQNCHIELDLAELQPGTLRALFLKWRTDLIPTGETAQFFTEIVTTGDAVPGNNTLEQTAKGPLLPLDILYPPPGLSAFRESLTATVMSLAHTQDTVEPAWHWGPLTATVMLPGLVEGEPNGRFGFRVNGVLGESFTLDANGNWEGPLPVGEGNNLVTVEYLEVNGYSDEELHEHNANVNKPTAFETRRGLPWNPATFQVWPFAHEHAGELAAAHAEGIAPMQVIDENGNSALEGWQLLALPDQDMTVSLVVADLAEMLGIQAECCAWPPVILQLDKSTPKLLTAKGDEGIHTGQFKVSADMDGAPVELIIGCDEEESAVYTQCWVFEGTLRVIQPAQVVDASTGNVVDGADFIIWRLRRGAEGIQPVRWHSGTFGQVNPVTSNAAGQVSIQLPAGNFYGLTVRHPDYQTRRVGPLTADFFDGGTVQLFPLPTEPATHEVLYTESGFSTGLLEVAPHALIVFQNNSLGNFEIQDFMENPLPAATNDASGLIPPGESFGLRVEAEGEIRLVNPRNPVDEMIIRVAEPQQSQPQIFLPIMERTAAE